MLVKKIRRQLFQIANGNALTFVSKISKIRKLVSVADSLFFGKHRLQKKILQIAPNLKTAIKLYDYSENLQTVEQTKIETILSGSRNLRDSLKLKEANDLLTNAQSEFSESVVLRKTHAQIFFYQGMWKSYIETARKLNTICDEIAEDQNLLRYQTRFLGSDWTGPLGHIVQLASIIKLEKLKLLSDEKRILLYDPKFVANNALLNLLIPSLRVIKTNRPEIEGFTKFFPALVDDVTFFRMKNEILDQWSAVDIANYEWNEAGNSPVVHLSDVTKEKGSRILKRWGLNESDWFVAMHIREGAHRSLARLPNAEIHSYFPMIKEVVRRGGYVVRMGSPLMKPLPPMEGVIDYAHATERIDWMDVFLWANAKFFIGTQSGGSEAAMCFGTPTIRSNFSSYGHCFWSEKSFMVPKRYKTPEQKTSMTLSEALNTPIPHCESIVHQDFEFEVIDNSEDDLLNAANEMFLRLDSQNWDLSSSQIRAQIIRSDQGAVGRLPIADSFLAAHSEFTS